MPSSSEDAVYILHPEQQQWMREIPQQLGERKFRLLLAGCCRLAFQPKGKLPRDVAEGLEILESFADTGKGKTALLDFRRKNTGWDDRRSSFSGEFRGLYEALNPKMPDHHSLMAFAFGIRAAHKISGADAIREMRRLQADLMPPSADAGRLEDACRSPAIVELATSMYQTRDFSAMPRVVDALKQAGCTNQAILDHCRDAGAIHIRGCWVIDAILDGSWAKAAPIQARGTEGQKKKNPLLSKLSKGVQAQVRDEYSRLDFDRLSLTEFLASTWDFEAFRRSHWDDPAAVEQSIADSFGDWSSWHPTWSPEQVKTAIAVESVHGLWTTNTAISRRIMRNDPSELAHGVIVVMRLQWLNKKLRDLAWRGRGEEIRSESIVYALAARDFELAERLSESFDKPAAHWTDEEKAILAAYRRDFSALQALSLKPAKGNEWITTCLRGIAAMDPEQVGEGLRQLLERERGQRYPEGFGIVNLNAHGFYRLCQWVSPELVSRFDVGQAFPWDAAFHAWTERQVEPLAGVDLRGIDPVLHDVLVLLKLPSWWVAAADAGSAEDVCETVLIEVGPKSDDVVRALNNWCGLSMKEGREVIARCPVVVGQSTDRTFAFLRKRGLEKAGASAEIRKIADAIAPSPQVQEDEGEQTVLPSGLTPIAVDLGKVKAALGSGDGALLKCLAEKFHAELAAVDARYADEEQESDDDEDDEDEGDVDNGDEDDHGDVLAGLGQLAPFLLEAKKELLAGEPLDKVLEKLEKNDAIPATLRKRVVAAIRELASDEAAEEAEAARPEAVGAEPRATTADALRHLIMGEPPDRRVAFKYGYGLYYICRHFGEELPHDAWLEMEAHGYEYIDKALRSAGVPGKTLSVGRHLAERGAPVPLPKIYHLPSMGYLTSGEIERALAALGKADVEDVDYEAQEYVEDIRSWLQTCADAKKDLFCFYV